MATRPGFVSRLTPPTQNPDGTWTYSDGTKTPIGYTPDSSLPPGYIPKFDAKSNLIGYTDPNNVFVGQVKGAVVNPDGSITYPNGDGQYFTSRPDGTSTVEGGGLTTNFDQSGRPTGTFEKDGKLATATRINEQSNAANGQIGKGGLLGLGSSGFEGFIPAAKAAAGEVTNQVVGGSGGGGSGGASADASSALAAAAALRDKFGAAYDAAAPGVAPVITPTLAKDPTLATYLAQMPVTTATAGQVGAIPQVVAPTVGMAPAVKAGTATAGVATPASSINVSLADAAQAKAEQLDPTQQAEWRTGQKTLAGYLNDAILGNAPSVAELQLREAEQRQEANQLGLAAKASGGGNLALALRTAANNIGRLNQGASADAALLRAKEIADARGQLGDVLNTARTGDINIADRNATLGTGVSQTNAGLATDVSKLNASNKTDASKTLAQLLTQASIANAGNTTQASVANANNETSASAQTSQNITTLLAKKAELEYQASHDNAGNALSAAETQAKLNTDVSLAAALAKNTADLQTQKVAADVSQTNANNSTSTNINNAKFINDAAGKNADNTLTQRQLDEKTKQDAAGNALDASRTVVNGNTGLQDLALRQQQQDWNKTKDIGSAIGAGAAILSDRREKTDVSDGEAAAQSILDAMSPKSYRYKDGARGPGVSPGRKVGVMAQDLERTPAGKKLVGESGDGKKLIKGGAPTATTLMAMLATLNKRMDRVEGRHAA